MKSLLNLMILATLTKENKYGLQIIKDIKSVSIIDIDLKLPSLYNSIKRLEGYGYLECYWENSAIGGKRRYCSLTQKGKEYINEQMELLSVDEKLKIQKLLDNNTQESFSINLDTSSINNEITSINNVKNDDNFNQNDILAQNEIAIQPTFLNQCETSTNFDDDKDASNENIDAQSQYINENQESFNFKDIFGDIVYDDIENETRNEAKQKLFNENQTGDLNANKIDVNDGLITEKQNIEDNYKVNVTLKSINKKPQTQENNNINTEKKLPSEENEIELKQSLNSNNQISEDKLLSKYNKIQEDMLFNNSPNETNTINECLKYFDEIGITYKVCNTNLLPKKEYDFGNDTEKFYKNKFKAKQMCLNSFICSLMLIICYITLDLFDLLKTPQKYIFLGIGVIIVISAIVAIFNLINNYNKVSSYKPPVKKNLILLLYISLVSILIVVAFCFFFGMTPINYSTYLAYMIFPALMMLFIYNYLLIGKVMAKKNKYFVK